MKKAITLLLLIFLSFQYITVKAQIDTAFWFATPFISPDNTPRDNYILHVYTFATPATVRLRQPSAIAPNRYDTTFTVPANTMFDYIFWRDKLASPTNRGFDSLEVQPSDVVLPYGLYISSTATISVVFDIATRSPTFYNPETFSLKGQNALGLEFLCPFQTKGNNMTLTDLAGTQPGIIQPKQQINIVASKPNITVWITPKCNIIGHLANVTYSIMLPFMGSAYTIENAVQTTTVAANNLSGTSVLSDKPIAVTVVDDATKGISGCYDLAGDQIVPVDEVGTEYVIIKGLLSPAENEGVYVVGTYSNTQLTINDGVTTTTVINKGDTYFYKTTQSLTSLIASKPLYALHFTGNGCEAAEGLIPSLGCAAGSTLAAFSKSSPQAFFLNLFCKNGVQNGFNLNNSTSSVTVPITASNFTIVPGTSTLSGGPYYGAQISMNSTTLLPIGSYTITNSIDVFGMGVFGGGPSTGSNYHYMSQFSKKPTVTAGNSFSMCGTPNNVVALNGTITGVANTGSWTTNGTGTFGVYTSTLNTISTNYTISTNDISNGSIKFYLTSLGGCAPKKDSIIVTLTPPPQITLTPGASICSNNTNPIALSSTLTNAAGGTWNTSGTGFFFPSNSAPNASYSPSAGDLSVPAFTLTYFTFSACGSAFSTAVYTVITTPPVVATSNASIICVGQSATLTASGANTYTWNTASTNTSIVVSPTTSTSYTVTGIMNGCSNTASVTQIVSLCTGILQPNGVNEKLVMIFPNPNNGEFTISSATDVKLTLTNELGQVVKIIFLNNSNNRKIDITHLANGIYFISGKVNDQKINQKIIVTK